MLISICRIPPITFSIEILFFVIIFNPFPGKKKYWNIWCFQQGKHHVSLFDTSIDSPWVAKGWTRWYWRSFPKLNDCVTLGRAGREGQDSAGAAGSPVGVVCVSSRGALLMEADRTAVSLYLNTKTQPQCSIPPVHLHFFRLASSFAFF